MEVGVESVKYKVIRSVTPGFLLIVFFLERSSFKINLYGLNFSVAFFCMVRNIAEKKLYFQDFSDGN